MLEDEAPTADTQVPLSIAVEVRYRPVEREQVLTGAPDTGKPLPKAQAAREKRDLMDAVTEQADELPGPQVDEGAVAEDGEGADRGRSGHGRGDWRRHE